LTHRDASSAGAGSAPGLYAELFKKLAGVDFATVNYRGSGPALSDLIAGQVHAPGCIAGCPADRRRRAGLRGQQLGRYRRAVRHAAGNCRHSQQAIECCARRHRIQSKTSRFRCGAICDFACGIQQIHRRIYCEVGQSDPGGRHQGGVTLAGTTALILMGRINVRAEAPCIWQCVLGSD
jgi:hypothetical protein